MPRILVGAAATAVANNTALSAGDIGVTNEGGMKVGPGNWNSLPFLATATAVQNAISAAIAAIGGSDPVALLSINGGTAGSIAIGGVITAKLLDGVLGTFQMTRTSFNSDGSVAAVTNISGATNGTIANSYPYTVVSGDAGCVIGARVTGLAFSATGAGVPTSAPPPPAPPPAPVVVALSDDFNDNSLNTGKWVLGQAELSAVSTDVTVAETGGRMQVTVPPNIVGYSGYASVNSFDFTGKGAFVRMVQPLNYTANASAETFFLKLTGNRLQGSVALWVTGGGQLSFSTWTGGTRTDVLQVAFNATTHGWAYLYESGGTIFAKVAPSTAANPPALSEFVAFSSATKPTDFALTAAKVYMFAGTWNGEIGDPGTAIFDGFNLST